MSNYIKISLQIQDINDNSPEFSQEAYYSQLDAISAFNKNKSLVSFEIKDKDLGIYGLSGLVCFITGDEADK